MHDPMTQTFVIPLPWRKWGRKGRDAWERSYRDPFITIWHNDPQSDHTDDSCGWFSPKLNKKQKGRISILASDEAREPWFQSASVKENRDPLQCENLVRGAFLYVALALRLNVSVEEATRWAILTTHNHVDNFRHLLTFLSGYHSNWVDEGIPNTTKQDKWAREQEATQFFTSIVRYILREHRPWYRHPKWHVWHWSFQIHFLEAFKRWAFSKCCNCGKGFSWGYCPGTDSWNGSGPRWFRSELNVYHMDCRNPTSDCCAKANPVSIL